MIAVVPGIEQQVWHVIAVPTKGKQLNTLKIAKIDVPYMEKFPLPSKVVSFSWSFVHFLMVDLWVMSLASINGLKGLNSCENSLVATLICYMFVGDCPLHLL